MASNQHNNLWAEKLMQVSLPDSGEAWVAMEALLDKEEPRGWKRDRRRWLLLALLLLLLIGVCNCPGRGRLFRGSTVVNQGLKQPPAAGRIVPGPTPPVRQTARDGGERPGGSPGVQPDGTAGGSVGTQPGDSVGMPGVRRPAGTQPGGPAGTRAGGSVVVRPKGPAEEKPEGSVVTRTGKSTAEKPGGSAAVQSNRLPVRPAPVRKTTGTYSDVVEVRGGKPVAGDGKISRRSHRRTGAGRVGAGVPADDITQTPALTKSGPPTDSTRQQEKTSPGLVKNIPSKDSARKQDRTPPALVKNTPAKDSVRKKRPPPVEEIKPKEKENGWLAGIGLNQFFPLGGQQSAYNSNGTGGTLSDYIPVPMIRYYFNRQLYIQLEAQINTPQATKKNLVINSPPPDTATIRGSTLQSSASIQKLFYFNVPVSVHYEPFDNLDIGAGLQFSRLTNAVGAFDSTVTNLTSATTTNSKAVKSFKGDTLYQRIKTNELRFLIDVNYTYKHFIFGLRYNQALSKFIHVEVAPGQITQSRNSSLQLYLRYILWDGRKKKPVTTK